MRVEQTNNHSVAVAALIGVGATLGFLVLLLTCWTLLHCLGYSGHPWRSRKKTVGDVETGEGDEGDQLQPVLPPCPTIPVRSPSLPSQGFLFREGEEGRGEDKFFSSLLEKHSLGEWRGARTRQSACESEGGAGPGGWLGLPGRRRLSSLVSEVFLPAGMTGQESENYCTARPGSAASSRRPVWSGISSVCSPVRRLSFNWPGRSPASTEPAKQSLIMRDGWEDDVFSIADGTEF